MELLEAKMKALIRKIVQNRRIRASFAATFILGMIAHAFVYFNAIYYRDMYRIVTKHIYDSATQTRWLCSPLQNLVNWTNIPVISGALTLIFLAVSVYMVTEIINFKYILSIWITAGLFVTSPAIIAAHLYTSTTYMYAFALMMGTAAVYIFSYRIRLVYKVLVSILFTALCAGTYGAYFGVISTLFLGIMIRNIFNKRSTKEVILKGMTFLLTMIAGLVLYYLILQIVLKVGNMKLLDYMGESRMGQYESLGYFVELLKCAYNNIMRSMFDHEFAQYTMPRVNIIITCLSCIMIPIILWYKKLLNKDNRENIMLLILIILILPLSMNIIYVMANRHIYEMLTFAYVFLYVYIWKLVECIYQIRNDIYKLFLRILCLAMTLIFVIIIYSGFILSNSTYVHTEGVYQVSLSLCTRLIDRIEQCDGYSRDKEIIIIGVFNGEYQTPILEDSIYDMIGKNTTTCFDYAGYIAKYLKGILGMSSEISGYDNIYDYDLQRDISDGMKDKISKMNSFPAKDSVKSIDGKIIVKLNEN